MRSEVAGLWFVPANGGEDIALLIKMPTPSIKALLAGCSMRLLFGEKDRVLCLGARIYDVPDSPVLISNVQCHEEEHETLRRAMKARECPVFLFNELDACVAWTNVTFESKEAESVLHFLETMNELYVGSFNGDTSHALDCFCFTADATKIVYGAHEIPMVEMSALLKEWAASEISYIGVGEAQTIAINNRNEGEDLEKTDWAALESVFTFSLYKGSQVKIGDKTRELTDVLAFYEYGAFFIETKDLSVFQAGYDRKQERRTSGVQKQIRKAIAQLVGASKAFRRGEEVFDKDGVRLEIKREKPSHCIVLVAELMHDGDWEEVVELLMEGARDTGDFFHLLDLKELVMILKYSSGKAELFDCNLMSRFRCFVKTRSVHIRSQVGRK